MLRIPLLSSSEIDREIESLKGWHLEGKAIEKTYRFRTFMSGIDFVNKVAELAERENHHPDIHISWRTITLSLTTHDEGGLTNRDFKLAKRLDGISKR